MRKIRLIILCLLSATILFTCGEQSVNKAEQKGENKIELVIYFQDTITRKVESSITNYSSLGLGGGVDGFILMKTYPGLSPEYFKGVRAKGGEYGVKENQLYYSGNAASDSPVITREGMKTLLYQLAKRLNRDISIKKDIDALLSMMQ